MNENIPFNKAFSQNLFWDYLYHFDKLDDLFEYSPWENDSFQKKAADVWERERKKKTHRDKLVISLKNYHSTLTKNSRVFNFIDLLNNSKTLVVVTGQQPGVLTGPLYSIYKAITAIKLAKSLSKSLGVHVLPVFWIASEDNDFDEVNNYSTLDKKGNLVNCKIENDQYGYSIGNRKIKEEAFNLMNQLTQLFQDSPYYEKWKRVIIKSLDKSETLVDWTANLLLELFADEGLIILDPMDPKIRELSKPIYKKAINYGKEYSRFVEHQSKQVKEMGYDRQVDLRKNHAGLFYYQNNVRLPLINENQIFKLVNHDKTFEKEELIDTIENSPWKFSPNVTLRPLVQDYLLPSVSYVAGPGEIGYFSQLKELYRAFEIKMPVIYPRESFLLIDDQTRSILEKYEIRLDNLLYDWSSTRKEVFKTVAPINTSEKLVEFAERFKKEHEEFIKELSQIDEDIEKLKTKNFQLIYQQLNYLKQKAEQYNRKNHNKIDEELSLLKNSIYPKNNLQERQFNIGEFLFTYDWNVLELLKQCKLNPKKIKVINLE
ncbi:bacillithiol biosynthesis cysteine-adding enzyme BshC [Natranaerobius trueperi]|uniref:Putative cysteine ligase BshC n=1 Tax=Natranaerobius trueperi TaxID=759412 RepID=A0A226BZH9_9FIRM|nr:bacillithiol biosynthesis cysteine-adding enzyme BshC [Natranaerobius trueperi]OWZ83599.1 bacillithiol biosynthesis cysteine-adding enzyme BshC [Natranaerobius trueperi]